ncbi:MAG: hypothetical protein CL876_01310 [Dehalococcoidales bacterium]|nr:hypothetical protein [Dehalococcoidales bacterium]
MNRQNLYITIMDDSNDEECEAGCGTDWSSREALDLAHRRIRDRFGGDIRLEYLDLSGGALNNQMLQWKEEIKAGKLALPLLVLNGRLRLAGMFDVRQLMDTIEVEREIGG